MNNLESFVLINAEVKGLKLLLIDFSIFKVKEIVPHFPVLKTRKTGKAMEGRFLSSVFTLLTTYGIFSLVWPYCHQEYNFWPQPFQFLGVSLSFSAYTLLRYY